MLVRVDRTFLGNQVAHVAVRSEDFEILAEVFLDGLRFGGRLDDDEVVGHQWGSESISSNTRSSMRAQACSCPGWLESTMSTSHLSRSMSTSSPSSATSRSMTISR